MGTILHVHDYQLIGVKHLIIPLLNIYEANVTLGNVEWKDVYPMDFYRKESGPWTNYFN